MKKSPCLLLALLLTLTACNNASEEPPEVASQASNRSVSFIAIPLAPKADTGRWYTQEQVNAGRITFRTYCSACHGMNAEQTKDWKSVDTNGNYPPPPLNGTAHAWHHPLSILARVIKQGGAPVGGLMPAWGDVLNDQQIQNVIASFQAYWSDNIYEQWLSREVAYREAQ